MPTIYDVAREAQVSTAAVSLVMNDQNTKRVGIVAKRRILHTAERLGYMPNSFAKALTERESRIIGLFVPMRDPIFFNQFIADVLAGIQSCLIERNYHLMIYSHGADSGRITNSEVLQSRYADGMIILNTRMCSRRDIANTIADLNKAKIPFVMVNSYIPNATANYVGVDDREVGRLALTYLAKRGHKQMAILGGAAKSPSSIDQVRGFLEAAKELHIRMNPELQAFTEYNDELLSSTLSRWFRMSRRPTAIYCLDNQLIPETYRSIEASGLRIPADVAVLGRGNPLFASNLKPALTTVSVPAFHIGKHAAELLLTLLANKSSLSQKILLPCSIEEQGSV